MISNSTQSKINKLVEEFNFKGYKKYKLIIFFGLLGDFDSFEYAINLKKFFDKDQNKNIDLFAIAIGNENGKKKFCNFTGFPIEKLKIVSDNELHKKFMISSGINVGLGGWINMLIMLSGINSLKTLKEVVRGYTGDRNSRQIFSSSEEVKISQLINFSGKSFKNIFGEGYLRPFELATFRLNNMTEILKNWDKYISNTTYLPQRGASFILDSNNKVIYQYFSREVLGYSSNMADPLGFLLKVCK